MFTGNNKGSKLTGGVVNLLTEQYTTVQLFTLTSCCSMHTSMSITHVKKEERNIKSKQMETTSIQSNVEPIVILMSSASVVEFPIPFYLLTNQ